MIKAEASLLYTEWALRHLLLIDQCIKRLSDQGNINLNGAILALYRERKKLIKENDNYARAQKLLEDLAVHGVISKLGDLFYGIAKDEEAS